MKRVVKKPKGGAERLRQRVWKKVQAPKNWRPEPGELLEGVYGGRTLRNGMYGQYEVILVRVPSEATTYMISGVKIIQLVDTALLRIGEDIRVHFVGDIKLGEDRTMRNFELYVAT